MEQATLQPVLVHNVPEARLILLKDLEKGFKFQYQGGDPEEWNTVLSIDEEKVHYQIGRSYHPTYNWRHYGSIYVWAIKPGVHV